MLNYFNIFVKVNKRAKAKCFRAWLVNTGGRDDPSDELLSSQFLFDDDYDSKNYDASGIVNDNAYEKKRALMKMINVIEKRSNLSKMDFWLSLRVHTKE